MSLAENIVKYRKKNNLSQLQLAAALSISRQSISKWETGENLPSIDNLISLSGLLDISLDELITGEPYLHFPFNYGKPKTRWPAILLILFITMFLGTGFGSHNLPIALLMGSISYFMGIYFTPFDFKRYYTYWTLSKTGITYVDNTKDRYDSWDEVIIPIKALLHIRKTQFVSYQQISRIEVGIKLFEFNPDKMIIMSYYVPKMGQYMREMFYLEITTKDEQKVYLDLRQYYLPQSKERQMLSTILSFLQRKNIEFVDKQNISEMVRDRNINITEKLYKLRDEPIEGK